MTKRPDGYRAYLLRMWREESADGWRCSIEDPRTGKREHFVSLEKLVEALTPDRPVMKSPGYKDTPDESG